VHSLFSHIFRLFLSPSGLVVLGALDSSMFFFLPVAIDAAVILLVAQHRDWFWIFPLLATAGSVAGIVLTFFMGRKIGEAGLKRWISERRLKTVQRKISDGGAVAVGVAALLPPPFPLSPLVLAGGALGLNKRKFFAVLGTSRCLRFGAESLLALAYGRRIIGWMQTDTFEYAISALMVLALAGTAVTLYQVVRRTR
jgi:membrane protein YqaA with SNARE-associated domain